jgi:hypothetical protein
MHRTGTLDSHLGRCELLDSRAAERRRYGEAVRHRARDAAVRPVPRRLDRREGSPQTFTTLDDENPSSLRLRLARPVTDAWSVETRGALWRDLGYATDNTPFAAPYFGVIYSK